jgi:hypothetical protein
MDRIMATRVLNRRTYSAVVLIAAAGVVFVASGVGNAAAEVPSCTLTAPAQVVVDKPYQEFTVSKVCTGTAPHEITWTGTIGTKETSELWFLQRNASVGDVYSDDPFGVWTWKPTGPADQPEIVYNEPTTEVRAKSVATATAKWPVADSATELTVHVDRYNPATNKMVPWGGATAVTESRPSPSREDTPWTRGTTTYTADAAGNLKITFPRPRFDRAVRLVFSPVAETFGATSNSFLVRAAKIVQPTSPATTGTR